MLGSQGLTEEERKRALELRLAKVKGIFGEHSESAKEERQNDPESSSSKHRSSSSKHRSSSSKHRSSSSKHRSSSYRGSRRSKDELEKVNEIVGSIEGEEPSGEIYKEGLGIEEPRKHRRDKSVRGPSRKGSRSHSRKPSRNRSESHSRRTTRHPRRLEHRSHKGRSQHPRRTARGPSRRPRSPRRVGHRIPRREPIGYRPRSHSRRPTGPMRVKHRIPRREPIGYRPRSHSRRPTGPMRVKHRIPRRGNQFPLRTERRHMGYRPRSHSRRPRNPSRRPRSPRGVEPRSPINYTEIPNPITIDFKRQVPNQDPLFIQALIEFQLGMIKMEVDDFEEKDRGSYSFGEMIRMFEEKSTKPKWEQTHSSIQWIFPTNQRSGFAGQTSPILPRKDTFISEHGQEIFDAVGNKIETSTDAYLYYLGNNGFLELTNDHNFLRITRVADSLQYFNKHDKAIEFLDTVLSEAINVNSKSKGYWLRKLEEVKKDKQFSELQEAPPGYKSFYDQHRRLPPQPEPEPHLEGESED